MEFLQKLIKRHKHGYQFSKDYVTHFSQRWLLELSEYKDKPNLKYLEIGVLEGRSLIWMLENILTHPTSKAFAVDPYDLLSRKFKETESVFKENLKKSNQQSKVIHIKDFSDKAFAEFQNDFFDIIYVDGNHDADYVEKDLNEALRVLSLHGTIIIDDYMYKPTKSDRITAPKIGIDRFLKQHADLIKVIFSDYQVFVRKRF